MEKPVCAVFDKKTGLWDSPFVVRHTGEAIREWGIITQDRQTKFGKNPEDFDLFEIGSYNDSTSVLTSTTPQHLASGVSNASNVRAL